MPRNKFKKLIKDRIQVKALEYLLAKQGSKGKEIKFTTLEMSEYLLPFNSILNIEEKRRMFELRNRMTQIPHNYGKKEEKCECGSVETMQHIYSCESLNQKKTNLDFNLVYNGNQNIQIEIFRRFEDNLGKRNKIKTNIVNPGDLSDPLGCISLDMDNKE